MILKYLLNCQIIMSLSSLADAKYRPSFDQRTQFTQAVSSKHLHVNNSYHINHKMSYTIHYDMINNKCNSSHNESVINVDEKLCNQINPTVTYLLNKFHTIFLYVKQLEWLPFDTVLSLLMGRISCEIPSGITAFPNPKKIWKWFPACLVILRRTRLQ